MIHKRFLRILAVALLLAILLSTLPTTPALAAAEIEIDHETGKVGDTIEIVGEGFREDDEGRWGVGIYFASGDISLYDEIDDEVTTYERVMTDQVDTDGTFDTTFEVPVELTDGDDDEDVTGGTYYICVVYYDSLTGDFETLITAIAEFTVAAGEIELDPRSGTVNTRVEVTGEGFGDREEITAEFDGSRITVESGNYETDRYGEFQFTFLIPESAAGTHTITVIGEETDNEAEATFTVRADIALSPETGAIGDQVTITGTGFRASRSINITFGGETVTTNPASVSSNSRGSFSATFTVPSQASGSRQVMATDGTNSDTANFIISATTSIDKTSGSIGDAVAISGTGFRASATITISFGTQQVASTTSDSGGHFSVTFNVPALPAGTHEVRISDGTNTAMATFEISATASLSKSAGYVGEEVTVTGTGFRAGRPVAITFDNKQVATATVGTDGSFSATFTVPAHLTGTYLVRITDGTNLISASFAIETSASISATSGDVGTKLTVSGNGFVAGKTAAVNYDGTRVASATVATDGTFSASFKVPASTAGTHTITVTDGTNTQQFTFTMESNPPDEPKPLTPETGAKAKSLTSFDWQDVTDASGVTYTLQIASNVAFSEGSIVFEKKGIALSQYTLTSDERLQSVSKDEPYYWRVRAVDGASNVSEWSGTGMFYVGFQFRLSQPVIYALFGVGALLCGIIGFWIGRRTVEFY